MSGSADVRVEKRVKVNDGEAWAREADLTKLMAGEVDKIAVFPSRDSDSPRARQRTKRDIWSRAAKSEEVEVKITRPPSRERWTSSLHHVSLL